MNQLDHFLSCSPATEANCVTLEFEIANRPQRLTISKNDAERLLVETKSWLQSVRYSSDAGQLLPGKAQPARGA